MKHYLRSLVALLILLFFLITYTNSLPTVPAPKDGDAEEIMGNMKLMGLVGEECQNEDEECLKSRATAEAHLDYIYTQHSKP